jgi:hypothetical protein
VPDPFVVLAAGRACFRPRDLLALADLLDGLRALSVAPRGEGGVK